MTITVCAPTFEHHREAIGIGESTPRISWRFASDSERQDWLQKSYEIEISRFASDEVTNSKTESFRVASSESVLVPWPSTPLASRQTARVRIRANSTENVYTAWSEYSVVETGLLKLEDWTAHVVAAEKILASTGALQPTLFRNSFKLDKKSVLKARLYITSYGVYEPSINGKRVGDHVMAPAWQSYGHRLCYQTFDVTKHLNQKENVIGVEVSDGWFSGRLAFGGGRRFIYGDALAVLAQLEVQYEDGSTTIVGSDDTWKTSTGARIASEIYDGEIYDASLEIKDWNKPSLKDDSWKAVTLLEFPKIDFHAPEGPPIRVTETVKPKVIWKSPTDKVIVDFGQNLVGGVRLRVSGPKGTKITLQHTEVLEHGEVATRPLRDCKALDTVILSGDKLSWEPKFTFHGFRYVQVDGWPSKTREPAAEDIEAFVIHTDMQPTGWFETSEPMVNQLYSNIRWGMRGNFVGLPTDCPQRDERFGWTGDIQVFSPTANLLYDTSGMLSGWLKDLSAEQIKDYQGVVPQIVPDVIDTRPNAPALAVWGDVSVITPVDLYLNYGDKQILQNQYESMTTWLNAIPRMADSRLWDNTRSQLGDWLDPAAPPDDPSAGKTDPQYVANAYLAHVSNILATVTRILGYDEAVVKLFEEEAATVKQDFQYTYITPAGRLSPDTMTSLSLALTFNLFATQSQTDRGRSRLAELSRASRFRIGTGFAGTPTILPALCAGDPKKNFKQVAYRMLLETNCPSWLYPLTMGATTMWERWDSMLPNGDINPGSMTSFNHYALGSVGKWLFSTVGGLDMYIPSTTLFCTSTDQSSIGWRTIKFAPQPGGTITWAKTSHLSPYGMISCDWELDIEKRVFKMKAGVPPNCKGVVTLPGTDKEDIEVGSGTYEFAVEGYEENEAWPPEAIVCPWSMVEETPQKIVGV